MAAQFCDATYKCIECIHFKKDSEYGSKTCHAVPDENGNVHAEKKVDLPDRKLMLLAMEFICRHINDENVLYGWLMNGVPDGDIPYGNFDPNIIDDDDTMLDDDSFKEIMECFLRRMSAANNSGGLYCDGVVAQDPN